MCPGILVLTGITSADVFGKACTPRWSTRHLSDSWVCLAFISSGWLNCKTFGGQELGSCSDGQSSGAVREAKVRFGNCALVKVVVFRCYVNGFSCLRAQRYGSNLLWSALRHGCSCGNEILGNGFCLGCSWVLLYSLTRLLNPSAPCSVNQATDLPPAQLFASRSRRHVLMTLVEASYCAAWAGFHYMTCAYVYR